MIDLRYPVLFVHGMGFRDRKRVCYWGRIPKILEKEGVNVYFGRQDANGSVDDNAAFLADRIRELANENGIEKFNVIAHSKGGIEMRKAIAHLGAAPFIASLTTISTPHNGSKTMDFFMGLPKWLMKAGCAVTDLWFRITGDKKPKTYEAICSFTTASAEAFNRSIPEPEGIYCQSYAFTFKTAFSDMLMFLPHLVVRHFDGENDGLLAPDSVRWLNFRGVFMSNSNRGISHCDEVDMRRSRLTKKAGPGISDITGFYLETVRELSEKGL